MTVLEESYTQRNNKKSYQILGEHADYEDTLLATLPPHAEPAPDTVDDIDRSELPDEVWFAACISPDRGAAAIAAYRSICATRDLYKSQLAIIHSARRAQDLSMTQTGAGMLTTGPTGFGGHSRPTITSRVAQGSEPRKLDRFELFSRQWGEVTGQLSAVTQRGREELAMERGPAWRSKGELVTLMEAARPVRERQGGSADVWNMSLREAWERLIPIGNIFSGLTLHVKDRADANQGESLMRIGRPLDPAPGDPWHTQVLPSIAFAPLPTLTGGRPGELGPNTARSSVSHGGATLGRSLDLRGRAWKDGQALRKRTDAYAGTIKRLAPHTPDLRSLALRGEALESQLHLLASTPVSLPEVESRMAEAHPAAFADYARVKQEMEDNIRAALEEEEMVARAAEAEAAALRPLPGPHLSLSSTNLLMSCDAAASSSGKVTMTHRDQRPRPLPPPSAISVPQPSGLLLPNGSASLDFIFRPVGVPLIVSETWLLSTTPPTPGPPHTLHVRAMSTMQDTSGSERAELDRDQAEKVKRRLVGSALERILRDVQAIPGKGVADGAAEAAETQTWDSVHVESEWPPLYCQPSLMALLRGVHGDALQAYASATELPLEEQKNKKETAAAAKKKGNMPELEPAPPKYPLIWDGTLAALTLVLEGVTALTPVAAAPLLTRVSEARSVARVPSNTHKIHKHAMRAVLLRAVDVLTERLEKVGLDYKAKLDEQAGKVAAVEASVAAAAAAGLPAPRSVALAGDIIDATWCTDKMQAAAKVVLKKELSKFMDEVVREKVAVGDCLEERLKDLDEAITGAVGDAPALEGLYWRKLEVLREWTRLGVPPREGVQ
ncbi:MAG: hypothetical protein WDW36_008941 [Sanguina aurantia]